jgi:hypothetical protein
LLLISYLGPEAGCNESRLVYMLYFRYAWVIRSQIESFRWLSIGNDKYAKKITETKCRKGSGWGKNENAIGKTAEKLRGLINEGAENVDLPQFSGQKSSSSI